MFTFEQIRMVTITTFSALAGFFTPTRGFITALILMFAFNIWAGMRSDGVSIKRCRNFSFRKFKNALCELLLYLFIVEMIYFIMKSCGDDNAAIIAVKSLTYVIEYVYLQNAFRNLVNAYPNKIALRIIYHLVRLEFTRALPSRVQEIIDRVEREHGEELKK